MSNSVDNKMADAIQVWKENNLARAEFHFDCGGDSFNDWRFEFFNKDEEEVEVEFLGTYFENAVFDNVRFYENSDGHYVGEAGKVDIELSEDEECFDYYKDAESEWEEQREQEGTLELSDKEVDVLQRLVSGIINSLWGASQVVYNGDVIISDEEEEIIEAIEEKISKVCSNLEVEDARGELSDDFGYTTNLNNSDNPALVIKDNKLHFSGVYTDRFYEPSVD